MHRSDINAAIDYAKATLREHRIALPQFAFWTPAEWANKGEEYDEIRICKLGWDVTDFGAKDFGQIGLTVFTVRNGHPTIDPYRRTVYCEKVLVVREGQRTPMHCHVRKQEDIICRAGGNLICQVYRRGPDGRLDDGDVVLTLDGAATNVPAGHRFVLSPGESIRLTPLVYHEFYAEPGSGTSVVGEVSTVNDDTVDNIFLDAPARFPSVIDDVEPIHLLCNEYPD